MTDEATIHQADRDRWNERYATQGCVWGLAPNRFVVEHTADLEPGRALDLGCGQGRNAIWLAARGHRVTAVDLSDVAVEQGRELAAEAGVEVEFIAADLTTWEPDPAAYDLVLLSYLQLVPAARLRVHRTAAAALAPGGTLLVIAHHLANLTEGVGGPPTPDVLYTEVDLAEDLHDLDVVHNGRVLRSVDKDGATTEAIDLLFIARRPAGL